jgi:hypothetical protein
MRLGVVHFPQLAVRIGTGGIEVPKSHVSDSVCGFSITQHPFHDEFSISIRIDGLLRVIFSQR